MKFSIITPSYNSGRFIVQTIESVIAQRGDFEIEHIIVDNCSTDDTSAIIERYRRMIDSGAFAPGCRGVSLMFMQGRDSGMYEAVNNGFLRATGDIYAWINADDIYLPGAFDAVSRALRAHPAIMWIKGIGSYINEHDNIYKAGACFMYDREMLKKGIYGREAYFVQQNSVFWRSELWKKSGGIDPALKLAGDYSLWIKFARYAPLYTVKAHVSCFRRVAGQKSADILSYRGEQKGIESENDAMLRRKAMLFFACEFHIQRRLFKRALHWCFLGGREYLLVDVGEGDIPAVKKVPYYVAD